MFAGFGPGRENTAIAGSRLVRRMGPRIGLAYAPDNKTTIRAAFGRSFSRVTAVQGSGHFAGFIGQYRVRQHQQRRHADVQLGPGTAGVYAAAFHRSCVLEWLQRRLVEWRSHARSGESVLDVLDAARDRIQHGARNRLQRQRRHAPANRPAELQSGAHEISGSIRPAVWADAGARAVNVEHQLRAGEGREHSDSLSELPEPATAHRRAGASPVPAVSATSSPAFRTATRAATRPITRWCSSWIAATQPV